MFLIVFTCVYQKGIKKCDRDCKKFSKIIQNVKLISRKIQDCRFWEARSRLTLKRHERESFGFILRTKYPKMSLTCKTRWKNTYLNTKNQNTMCKWTVKINGFINFKLSCNGKMIWKGNASKKRRCHPTAQIQRDITVYAISLDSLCRKAKTGTQHFELEEATTTSSSAIETKQKMFMWLYKVKCVTTHTGHLNGMA